MYCNFFGLRCRPFEDRADTRFLCATADCEEALAAMEYEGCYGEGMALVLGGAGTGKTLLIRSLLQRLDTSHRVVVLTWLATGQINLIREAAKGFGVSLPPANHDARCLARLRRHLIRRAKTNTRVILIIDQAEHLTSENMTQLATLADLRHSNARLLSITLVGQPRIRSLLDRPEFARISQQLYGECILPPLTCDQTGQYVQHRLQTAGAVDARIFDREAVALIHEAAGGIPRLINHICDAAMLAAYGAGVSRINREMAAEITRATGPRERAIDAREVGIDTTDRVAAGLTGASRPRAPTEQVAAGLTGTTQPFVGAEQASPREVTGAGTTGTSGSRSESDLSMTSARGDDKGAGDQPVTGSVLGQTAPGQGFEGNPPNGDLQKMLSLPVESFSTNGEGMLDRLERALARADRMNATTDASLAQFTAVERHLNSLSDGAERLITSLTETVQRATQSVDSVQRRLDEILVQAEDRMGAVEAQMSQTSEVSSDIDEQANRIEHTCEHADEVESRLKSIAEQLADKADEVQERVALLMTGLGSGEEAQNKLAGLLQQASSVTADAQETINSLQLKSQEAVERGERFQEQFANTALETYRAKMQEHIERYERSGLERIETTQRKLDSAIEQASTLTSQVDHRIDGLRTALADTRNEAERFQQRFTENAVLSCQKELERQLNTHLREQHEVVETALAAHRAKLQEMIDLSASQVRTVDEASTAGRRQVDETLEAINNKIDRHRQLLEVLEQREGDVESSLAAITDGLAGAGTRATELSEAIDGFESSVGELTSRAEAAKTGLANVVPQSEKLVLNVHAAYGQIEAGQRTVGAMLAEVGGACERVNALRDQATQCQDIVTRLSSGRTEGETTMKQLEETIASARTLLEAIQRAVEDAAEKSGSVDSQCASATEVLNSLSQANAAGQTTVEQLNESARSAEETAETTNRQITQLTGLQSTSANVAGQLDELVTSANQLHEAMQGLVAHVDEKIGQLSSHHAAATSVLRNLSDTNVSCHSLLERVNESRVAYEQLADNTKGQIDRLVQDLSALTARTEVNAKELDTRNTTAAELIDKLNTATTPAEKTATQLTQYVDQAKQYLASMAEQCNQAGDLAERLNTVMHLLTSAKEAEASVEKATQDARSTHDQLVGSSDAARQHVTTLQELIDFASALIETHEQVKQEAEGSTERLSAQLTATEKLFETARPLLDQFVGQARALQEKLRDLEGGASRIEDTLHEATARPLEIVASAQAEAAQLEQVCAAVRKVFTGLSQASLEAKQRSAECTQATQETAKQRSQLTTETDRAANTLNQWVEEALRAQSRLEKTLEDCPSIRETHPGDVIHRVSRIVRPGGRITNASAIGKLEMLSEPGTTEPPRQEGTAKPPARAEEISQLIEDAKRAVAEAKPQGGLRPQPKRS